jgi:hypothetical protein
MVNTALQEKLKRIFWQQELSKQNIYIVILKENYTYAALVYGVLGYEALHFWRYVPRFRKKA